MLIEPINEIRRAFVLMVTFLSLLNVWAQNENGNNLDQEKRFYKDERDGNVYETILLNDLRWFKGSLRYVSERSFFRNKDSVSNANFYAHLEAENVCPSGWRLPNFEEWKKYILFIEKHQNASKTKIKSTENSFRYRSKDIDFYSKDNPLDVQRIGRVEKGQLIMFSGSDYWVEGAKNELTHVHFLGPGFVNIHSHTEDVFEDNEVLRMFKVKCVCENDN
ncbi:MAG: FISUMP domain-containing protein [Flavobacteriaceae bacterium]